MAKLAYITLGCPKNQADTEQLRELAAIRGFACTEDTDDADVLVVNTCCFIDDAKRESIEVILELARRKRRGGRLIISGCMGKKYRKELEKEIPEIDAVFGVEDQEKILSYLEESFENEQSCTLPSRKIIRDEFPAGETLPYAYVKIADGCNRGCSFCVIPSIRGKFRSVPPQNILERVASHIHSGIREIVLVAQDITEYGSDLRGYDLSRLITDIAAVEGDFWVRLLYLHPAGIDKRLLETIGREDKVCKYVDIPVQHISDRILKAMNRKHDGEFIRRKIAEIREAVPGVTLRTSLIVGFPGESRDEFRMLRDFVIESDFDRLGVFEFSPQESTRAAGMTGKIPSGTKRRRMDEIMKVQSEISFRKNLSTVGRTYRALVDSTEEGDGIARLSSHAPEIDGVVVVKDCPAEAAGRFAEIRITESYDYDLAGIIVSDDRKSVKNRKRKGD